MKKNKVYLLALGCPKNLVNSEQMLYLLEQAGYEIVTNAASADVAIVNTCGFIDNAKSEAIESILELAELKKEGDVSGLAEGTFGIHIIKRYGDVSTEPVALDEVKEDIKNLILSNLKDEMYDAKIAEWKEGLEIVTYDKRVQYVGVNQ